MLTNQVASLLSSPFTEIQNYTVTYKSSNNNCDAGKWESPR